MVLSFFIPAVFSPSPETKELKETHRISARVSKNSPSPIILPQAQGGTPTPGSSTPESTTPTSKSGRRSFWEMLVCETWGGGFCISISIPSHHALSRSMCSKNTPKLIC